MSSKWQTTVLSDCVEILDSKRIPINSKERAERKQKATQLYPYYGATGQVDEINDFLFEGEHVLIGEDGAPFLDPFKPTAYIVDGKFWVNNHAHILKANGKTFNKYLLHYINHANLKPFVSGTTRLKLNQSSLKNIPIKFPKELVDQQKIVDKIEELFSVIDNLKLNLDESKRKISLLKQSIYNQTLVANVPMIPLKQLSTEIKYGYTSKSSSDIKGVPIIRITDIQDDSVDWSSVPNCIITDEDKSNYLLRDGDIVFARSGNTVGKTYKVGSNDPNSVYASYLIRIRLGSDLMSDYLYSYFQSADYWGKIKKGSSGVGQPNFNGTKLGNMMIPVPDITTQGRISNQVKYQISLIKNQESSIRKEVTKLNMFKQAILMQAFEGKLI